MTSWAGYFGQSLANTSHVRRCPLQLSVNSPRHNLYTVFRVVWNVWLIKQQRTYVHDLWQFTFFHDELSSIHCLNVRIWKNCFQHRCSRSHILVAKMSRWRQQECPLWRHCVPRSLRSGRDIPPDLWQVCKRCQLVKYYPSVTALYPNVTANSTA